MLNGAPSEPCNWARLLLTVVVIVPTAGKAEGRCPCACQGRSSHEAAPRQADEARAARARSTASAGSVQERPGIQVLVPEWGGGRPVPKAGAPEELRALHDPVDEPTAA